MNPIRTRVNANPKLVRRVCRQIRPVQRDIGSKNRPHIQAIPFASSANRVPKANNALALRDKSPTETAVVKLLAPIRQTRHASADQATALPAAKTATAATTVPNVPTGLSCVQTSANQKPVQMDTQRD